MEFTTEMQTTTPTTVFTEPVIAVSDETVISESTPELPPVIVTKIYNRGNGAGGANTNHYGKIFENTTNNEERLINEGFHKELLDNSKKTYNYCLVKSFEGYKKYFVLQSGLKLYMKKMHNIDLFRCPDEAYIFEYENGTTEIKILEKKEQNVQGSVETKLWSGPSLKREYELVLGDNFKVSYGFCVSSFLKNKIESQEKKYKVLLQILNESNIQVLYGDDENYFIKLDDWINN